MARRSAARAFEEMQEELVSVVENARVSREDRRASASRLRQWYDYGTENAIPAQNNKLRSHLDRLMSYLWSADTVRFGIHVPPSSRQPWLAAASMARDEFRQVWTLSGADRTLSAGLETALVYGSAPLKIQYDAQDGFTLDTIDPWDFGVTREDQPELEDQDAFAHWYTLSYPQFERWVQDHPRESELTALARDRRRPPYGSGSTGPLIVSAVTGAFPNTSVSTVNAGESPDAAWSQDAQVREPVLYLVDVWQRRLYHDPTGKPYEDWRVTTAFDEDLTVLVRRRNPILPWLPSVAGTALPSEHPFTMLVPRPAPNYFWGRSSLLDLIGLQTWREKQIQQMREVITRQLDPAKLFIGIPNAADAGRAMSTPGGSYSSPDPGGKMETIQVQVGQEAFGMLKQIDEMFEDQSGIPPLISAGEQPGGVRANSQLLSLAGIGAGRVRHMALQLEATLSRVATLAFHVTQRHDAQTYEAPDGTRFILSQLPPGTALQVSAHSASPIFAEQTQAKALELLKAGAIGGEWLTELLDPPYREEIKDEAKKREIAKSQHQEKLVELELSRLRLRRGGRGS